MLRRVLIALACVIGGVVVLAGALVAIGWLHAYRIPSSAMEPTLHCARPNTGCEAAHEDKVVSLRYRFFSPKRGDLVVFHAPALAAVRCGVAGTFVKRVVGLPGETWAERNGVVYIDGRKLGEPYVKADRRDTRTVAAVRIPAGRYYLLGDNRASSCDSREWGTVAKSALIGRLVARYWPLGRLAIL